MTQARSWAFSFRDDALYWLERQPVTEIVEGEEFTLLSGPGKGETRVAKRIIRAALKERLAREGKVFASGTGTYDEEGGKITFKFDPPDTEASLLPFSSSNAAAPPLPRPRSKVKYL